jgi:putative heme-binding domain-containing protein
LFALLAADPEWRLTPAGGELLGSLAEQAGLHARQDQVAEILRVLDDWRQRDADQTVARNVVGKLTAGLTRARSPLLARVRASSGSRAGQLLAEILSHAKTVAMDHRQLADRRAQAARSLALAPADEVVGLLTPMLDSRQPPQVQTAALASLHRVKDPRVAGAIVDAWAGFSPQVRAQAAEAMFGRPERLTVLLTAVENGEIARSQLDPARVDMLLSSPDENVRKWAARLFAATRPADREATVAAYREVLEWEADPVRGKQVFKKECAICHRLEGEGYDLGLPLQSVRNRGKETILVSVLDPNREVNPTYLNYVVLTEDGLSFTGMIASETATSITLKRAENQSDTVLRTEIDVLQSTGKSIMPEGLEKQIPKQDMADLIEYLMQVH